MEGYESLNPWWIVEDPGPLAGFELRLDRESYAVGDELVAKLRNITKEKQETGNKYTYDIQYEGADGWHTIIGTREDDEFGWDEVGYLFPPGNGWTWRLTLTQPGVWDGWDGEGSGQGYFACQPLTSGNYRFVYWGVGESEDAIGIPFTVYGE
jgi:hypothetical protein